MPKNISKFIYWTPRIASIVFILFLSLFSLDIFDSCDSLSSCAIGLFMHNIPVFILAILLWVSWKHEIVGGIAFILAGVLYISFILINIIKAGFEWYYLAWAIQISGIAFFIGILFLMNWYHENPRIFRMPKMLRIFVHKKRKTK